MADPTVNFFNPDNVGAEYAVYGTLVMLCGAAVALRFVSRRRTRIGLKYDDWAQIPSLVRHSYPLQMPPQQTSQLWRLLSSASVK